MPSQALGMPWWWECFVLKLDGSSGGMKLKRNHSESNGKA